MDQENNQELISKYGKKNSNKKSKKIIYFIIVFILLVLLFIIFYFKKSIFGPKHTRILILGYGAVGRTILPLFFKKFKDVNEYILADKKEIKRNELPNIPSHIKVTILKKDFTHLKLKSEINSFVKDNDIVVALSEGIETLYLLKTLNTYKNIIYADASIENDFGIKDHKFEIELHREVENYINNRQLNLSGVVEAGANPGMITHFSILGIYEMANSAILRKIKDWELIKKYLNEKNLPKLAEIMKVDVIHISELDSLEPIKLKDYDFTKVISNTWCVSGFHYEWNRPGEISVGTHDKKYFEDNHFRKIPDSNYVAVPYPSYSLTGSPFGIFTGKNVEHPETIEISEIFTSETHCPTVSFIYRPSRVARQGLENPNYKSLEVKTIDELSGGKLIGNETMGATIISSRKDIPDRWYGSVITAQQSRDAGVNTNPVVLQVAAGLYSHIQYLLNDENHRIGFPHTFESEEIMKYAKEFLGTIHNVELPQKLPTDFKDLISTKEKMDYDLIKINKN